MTGIHSGYRDIHNITQLTFRKNAGFLHPNDDSNADFRSTRQELTVTDRICLKIMDETPSQLTETTIGFVLDILDASWNTKSPARRDIAADLQLQCHPAVFSSFVRQLDSRDWFSLDLYITLLGGRTTYQDTLRHLESLADLFSRNWTYDRDRQEHEIVSIHAINPVPAALAGSTYGADKVEVRLDGALVGGEELDFQPDEYGPRGFMAFIDGKLYVNRKPHRTLKSLKYRRHYTCSHVPVPEERLMEDAEDEATDLDDEEHTVGDDGARISDSDSQYSDTRVSGHP